MAGYRDLKVWRLAMELIEEVAKMLKGLQSSIVSN